MRLPFTDKAVAASVLKDRAEVKSDNNLSEFAQLYHDYFPRVFTFVYGRVNDKDRALDIVSDVFERAFIKQSSLRSQDAFGPWIFTIARNAIATHWRKEKSIAKGIQDSAWQAESNGPHPSPESFILHRERLANLTQLVCQLPKREQEVISLKFDAELSNREIAQVLGTSEVNVRVTMFRALRKLRDRLQQGVI